MNELSEQKYPGERVRERDKSKGEGKEWGRGEKYTEGNKHPTKF